MLSDSENFVKDLIAGGISAAIGKTTIAPIERVKLILQLQAVNKQVAHDKVYKGIIDALVRIPREQGFLSYWRGNFTNIIMYFPTQSLNFAFKNLYQGFIRADFDRNKFWNYFLANLASGGLAGASALSITYPLDFARTRLSADIGKSLEERTYKGLADCLTKTAKSDGIKGLYRGFHVLVGGIFFYRACYFGIFDTAKGTMCDPTSAPMGVLFIIAQGVTIVSGLMSYPFDTVGRRLMMQSGIKRKERAYKGGMDCVLTIYKKEGAKGFYKGALTNIYRGMGGAVVLVVFDKIKAFI
ncbi:unnamed protein product [Psylliodes chrysocephalus]|uniref:ADP/ATP translocase n=1 Tax=Psylliodes chrysocephalus TaxID=3402493 RepID=A0A9P0CIL7_9CUCU|nr:unnamed protein product [Psylliodes chrysocephala]